MDSKPVSLTGNCGTTARSGHTAARLQRYPSPPRCPHTGHPPPHSLHRDLESNSQNSWHAAGASQQRPTRKPTPGRRARGLSARPPRDPFIYFVVFVFFSPFPLAMCRLRRDFHLLALSLTRGAAPRAFHSRERRTAVPEG